MVVLPETSMEARVAFAERLRERIEGAPSRHRALAAAAYSIGVRASRRARARWCLVSRARGTVRAKADGRIVEGLREVMQLEWAFPPADRSTSRMLRFCAQRRIDLVEFVTCALRAPPPGRMHASAGTGQPRPPRSRPSGAPPRGAVRAGDIRCALLIRKPRRLDADGRYAISQARRRGCRFVPGHRHEADSNPLAIKILRPSCPRNEGDGALRREPTWAFDSCLQWLLHIRLGER